MNMNVGTVLLAVWLVLYGIVNVFQLHFRVMPELMGILAILAGVFIVIGSRTKPMT